MLQFSYRSQFMANSVVCVTHIPSWMVSVYIGRYACFLVFLLLFRFRLLFLVVVALNCKLLIVVIPLLLAGQFCG